MQRIKRVIFLLITALLVAGCGRPFTAFAPDGFALYNSGPALRAVSHDRVVYRVRHLKNSPYAQFQFWREALPKRMHDAGYRIVSDSVMSINKQDALLLEMVTPLGNSDYSYIIMMMVKGEMIILGEAAGEVEKVQKNRDSILKALNKIVLR